MRIDFSLRVAPASYPCSLFQTKPYGPALYSRASEPARNEDLAVNEVRPFGTNLLFISSNLIQCYVQPLRSSRARFYNEKGVSSGTTEIRLTVRCCRRLPVLLEAIFRSSSSSDEIRGSWSMNREMREAELRSKTQRSRH